MRHLPGTDPTSLTKFSVNRIARKLQPEQRKRQPVESAIESQPGLRVWRRRNAYELAQNGRELLEIESWLHAVLFLARLVFRYSPEITSTSKHTRRQGVRAERCIRL